LIGDGLNLRRRLVGDLINLPVKLL
jgi:hypothetical protein